MTYEAFKNALINGFRHTISVHTKSILEYFLAMHDISSKNDFYLDDQSLMECCIKGISDRTSNKISYRWQNLSEFEEKLKIKSLKVSNKLSNFHWNKIDNSGTPSSTNVSISPSHTSRLDGHHKKDKIICFNCSKFNHIFCNCPNLYLGPKYKICFFFGQKILFLST